MIYYVYILQSKSSSRSITYTGYTNNLKKRLLLHNTSLGAKFTKGNLWEIIYKKKFLSKSNAMSYEYLLKSNKRMRLKIYNNF